jgi:hypothetical protein
MYQAFSQIFPRAVLRIGLYGRLEQSWPIRHVFCYTFREQNVPESGKFLGEGERPFFGKQILSNSAIHKMNAGLEEKDVYFPIFLALNHLPYIPCTIVYQIFACGAQKPRSGPAS